MAVWGVSLTPFLPFRVQYYWQHADTGEARWDNPVTAHDIMVLQRRHARGAPPDDLPNILDAYFNPLPGGDVIPYELAE